MAKKLLQFCLPQIFSNPSWLITLLWIIILPQIILPCPKVCQCKWRNGKKWVTCSNAKFIDIPKGLDPSTQVLNLEYNNLKILFTHAFFDRSLVRLQKVFLSHCKLVKLEKGSLKGLVNLIELELSHNLFTSVPSAALRDVSELRELLLKENRIIHLDKDQFRTTPNLVLLDVSFNNIMGVDSQAFASLNRLEVLKISGNKISTFESSTLMPLVALSGFHIHFNPWHCDCKIRLLREFILNHGIVTSIPPACTTPDRIKGRQWKILAMDDFVCFPKITTFTNRIFAAEGNNVSFSCSVNVSEVKVMWIVAGNMLSSYTTNPKRYKLSETFNRHGGLIRKTSNLTITDIKIEDMGIFTCLAENKAGQDAVNMTFVVSEKMISQPLIASRDIFVAVIAFATIICVLPLAAFLGLIVRRIRKRRHCQNENNQTNDTHKTSSSSAKCIKNNLSNETNCNKVYEYQSIPSEISDEAENRAKDNKPSMSHAILKDFNKENEEIQANAIKNNGVVEQKDNDVSYVEIPKASEGTAEKDDNLLTKNLGEQYKEEISPRKSLNAPPSNSKWTHYPDLLDLPSEQQLSTKSQAKRFQTSSDTSSTDQLNLVHHRRAPSLPCTPMHRPLCAEPSLFPNNGLLQVSGFTSKRQSLTVLPTDDIDLEFRAVQLELFLQEYRNLQDYLFRIKASRRAIYEQEKKPRV